MSYFDQEFSDLDRTGLTLIEGRNLDEGGSNGAGKSSLWDGISFALFGQTVRGLKGDDVIHRKAKKGCSAEVEFEFKGKQWKVFRSRKENRFYVETDGKITELGTQDMTQAWLERELEIDYDLYRSTVVFGQEETFNFVNETNAKQKDILSKIMRINYDVFQKKTKDKVKELKSKGDDIARKIDILNAGLVEDHSEIYAEEIEEWEEKKKAKLETKKNKIRELKAELDEEKEKSGDEAKLDKELKDTEGKLEKVNDRIDEHQQKVSDLRASIKLIQNDLDGADELFRAPTCPTCKAPVDGLELAERLKHQETEKASQEAELRDAEGLLDLTKKNKENLRKKAHDLRNQIMAVRMIAHNIKSLEEEIAKLVKEFKELQAEVNPWIAKKEDVIKKQDDIKKKITELQAEQAKVDDILPYLDFWVNAFGDSGIKSFVFDLICSGLTTKSNEYLNTLTNGRVVITFDTQKKTKSGEVREKFDCDVKCDGQSVKYSAYSGGEKRRIALAVDMALASLMQDYYVQDFNIIVFDEQTNFLDADGRRGFMNLVREISKKKRVFVVDHDAEFRAMFDDVITISKKDGVSRIS